MILVLTGENHFELQQKLRSLTRGFIDQHGDMAFERIVGAEASFERIQGSIQSMPFLATQKMVVLDSPSDNKDFLDKFESLLKSVSEDTALVINEPKIDKRTAYYKWLKKHTELTEFKQKDTHELIKWVVEYAKEFNSKISNSDAQYLLERVGVDQLKISNEIKKLTLAKQDITREVINDLTEKTPESKIFDLLDAAFSGNKNRAIELYNEQRSMKVEPQEILSMLGWQLRQLALFKTAGTKHDVVSEAKMNPYVARKLQSASRLLSYEQVKSLIHKLVNIDVASKLSSLDLDDALQAVIISI